MLRWLTLACRFRALVRPAPALLRLTIRSPAPNLRGAADVCKIRPALTVSRRPACAHQMASCRRRDWRVHIRRASHARALDREQPARPRWRPAAHRRAAVGAARRGDRLCAHASGLARRDEVALASVLDDLARAADIGRDDRHAERHRLDQRAPERLLPGGQQQHVQRADDLRHVLALPQPRHAILQDPPSRRARAAARRRPRCQSASSARRTWPSRSAAGARRPSLAQQPQRFDRGVLALPRAQLGDDAQQRRRPPASPSRARAAARSIASRVEPHEIDGVVHDLDARARRRGPHRPRPCNEFATIIVAVRAAIRRVVAVVTDRAAGSRARARSPRRAAGAREREHDPGADRGWHARPLLLTPCGATPAGADQPSRRAPAACGSGCSPQAARRPLDRRHGIPRHSASSCSFPRAPQAAPLNCRERAAGSSSERSRRR